jgi:hypothetical protein
MALKRGKVAPVVDEQIVEDEELVTVVKEKKKAAPKPAPAPKLEAVEEVEDVEEAEVIASETEEVEVSQSKEVSTEAHGGAMTRPSSGQNTMLASAEDVGFSGLKVEFGAFPILKMDKGSFMVDDDELDEKEIDVVLIQSRPKYIYKEADVDNTDVFTYSYDQKMTTSGESLEDWIREQTAQGMKIEVKEYLEVVAEIVDGPEDYIGEIVLMSIPPTSKSRFSGYVIKLMRKTGRTPDKVVTRISVGKRLKKGSISWNPWKFQYVKNYEG